MVDSARFLAQVKHILDADLIDLTRGQSTATYPSFDPALWDLPKEGKQALWSYGLPCELNENYAGITSGYEQAPSAQKLPLTEELAACYRLGNAGVGSIVARAGAGDVWYLPRFTDVPPQLQELHPEGIRPELVNSTITSLVECTWRWHLIIPIISECAEIGAAALDAAWMAADEKGREELPDIHPGFVEVLNFTSSKFQAIDPEVMSDRRSFWRQLLDEMQ